MKNTSYIKFKTWRKKLLCPHERQDFIDSVYMKNLTYRVTLHVCMDCDKCITYATRVKY